MRAAPCTAPTKARQRGSTWPGRRSLRRDSRLRSSRARLASRIQPRRQQSGLTPDQVPAQLAAAGYPPNLLHAFLGTTQPGQPTPLPTIQTLAAIRALGLGTGGQDSAALQLDTGFVRARAEALHAESLATGNYVFGTE